MSLLIPVACMALLALFLGAILHPILTTRHAWRRATGADRVRLELTERKEQLYASIKELEFDRSLGKVDDDDFQALRDDLEAEAVEVLRRLDALDGHADVEAAAALDARIEADITARRQSPAAAPAVAVVPRAFCHQCGQPRAAQYRFCPHCGQAFDATAAN